MQQRVTVATTRTIRVTVQRRFDESDMQHDPENRDELTIYHNPSCSKSRETLALIEASGLTPHIIEYLKTPPTESDLTDIVRKLGLGAADLVRTTEPLYRDKYSGKTLDDAQWIKAVAADPILLQRPIVVRGNEAVIGRPPENVKRLLR